jgi:class 3 adenylate cyclase/CHASE2 domain-containing sensor protein
MTFQFAKHRSAVLRFKWGLFLIPAAVAVFFCFLYCAPARFAPAEFANRLESMSFDWRVRWSARMAPTTATNLGAVFISDASIGVISDGSLGFQYGLYWPRHLYGRVVRELSRQGAAAVGFDIAFGETRQDHAALFLRDGRRIGSDEFFAREIKSAGNVILAAARGFPPTALFRTNAIQMGDITAEVERDGILRRARAFLDYRIWHPLIVEAAHLEGVDLVTVRRNASGEFTCRTNGATVQLPFALATDAKGYFDAAGFMTEVLHEQSADPSLGRAPAYVDARVWNMGIALAARALGLDLEHAEVTPGRIILRGRAGIHREIPVDADGRFVIDWSIPINDPGVVSTSFEALLARDILRENGMTNETPDLFKGRLVMVGSTATGNDLRDKVATSLEKETFGISQHWNVANALMMDRLIRPVPVPVALGLILAMSLISAWLTWRLRMLWASFMVLMLMIVELAVALALFVQMRIWVPVVLPVFGGLLTTHLCMVTYRVIFEERERRRVRSVFSRLVSPEVVNELLNAESLSLGGASRRMTIFFADVRGFTEITDAHQARAAEFVRVRQFQEREARQYFDAQAREMLMTVNLYLSVVADIIKKHNGTLDKYIGDCVMAFWGAPTVYPDHAVRAVRAAIEIQRAIFKLNETRAEENRKRETDNAAGRPHQDPLTLLDMGTGLNTGVATVGLMGSDQHILNYTVFGREVNVASRLEGVSGRSRIIISASTHADLLTGDPVLAATCREQSPVVVKGIREPVRIYEVPWRQDALMAQV